MPPQYLGSYSDPKDTEGHVRRAIVAEATSRLQLWTTFVVTAIAEFESAANMHIDELDSTHEASCDFNPILGSFVSVVTNAFPPTATASSIFSTVMNGIQSSFDAKLQSGVAGAKLRLRRSVLALAHAARERITVATSTTYSQMAEGVEDAMTWVDSASTDPAYVSAFCDWMGFPVPTRENTENPVRQGLENPFFGIYESVRAQILRTQGVSGLDENDIVPAIWQHDAVQRQRQLYDELGPVAWQHAYDEST